MGYSMVQYSLSAVDPNTASRGPDKPWHRELYLGRGTDSSMDIGMGMPSGHD